MATVTDWMKAAEEQAKKHSDAIKTNNQYLIDQLNQSKQNTLNQLQEQQNNSIYNLNTNKATINQNAVDNAKQLNVAKLIALKDNQSAMNRSGLGTQGVVGSQVNAINNDYATNLTNVLNQKTNDLRNLEKEKNNTLLTYNTNRLNLENEHGNNLANLQQAINDKALDQYNNVYNNYLAYKQQEYENEQAELARQEAIRQYNEQLAYQKQQDAIANAQKWAQINAQKEANKQYNFDENSNSKNGINTVVSDTDLYNKLYTASGFSYNTESGLNNARSYLANMIEEAHNSGKLSDAEYNTLCDRVEQMTYSKPKSNSTNTNSTSTVKNTTIKSLPTQINKLATDRINNVFQ